MLFIFSFVSFGVNFDVYAASENLIDSNLLNWEHFGEAALTDVYGNSNIYRLTVEPISSDSTVSVGFIYDISNVTAGHSCTLSFKMPTADEIAEAWSVEFTDTQLSNQFKNSNLCVGFGYRSSDGYSLSIINELYTINSNNLKSFLGKTVSASFVAEGGQGVPCIIISASCADSNVHRFFFKNFSLIDNDDNSAELDGIKGFLHSIRWDLVGGVCEESDCPHSDVANPHLSLSERAKNAFNQFFTDLQFKIDGLQTDINSGNVSIGGWFSDIGEKLSTNFSNNINTIKENFTGLITDMKSSFSDLGTELKNKLTSLGDSIGGFFDNIWSKFDLLFDKFKPRIYFEFRWNTGYTIDNTTGELSYNSLENSIPHRYNAVVTDLFSVPSDAVYMMDYINIGSRSGVTVYQYDLSGNYIGSLYTFNSSTTESVNLPSGYSYRFYARVMGHGNLQDYDDVSGFCNSHFSVYADEGWLSAFAYKLKLSVSNLIYPSEYEIDNFKDEIDTTMSDHLGIVYTSFYVLSDLFTTIQNIISDDVGDLQFTFPEVAFSLSLPQFVDSSVEWSDIDFVLITEKNVNMKFLETNSTFSMFYSLYRVILVVILTFALLNYAYESLERRIH